MQILNNLKKQCYTSTTVESIKIHKWAKLIAKDTING